jgi:hypothetical protein
MIGLLLQDRTVQSCTGRPKYHMNPQISAIHRWHCMLQAVGVSSLSHPQTPLPDTLLNTLAPKHCITLMLPVLTSSAALSHIYIKSCMCWHAAVCPASCNCAEQVRDISRPGVHSVREMQQGARPNPIQHTQVLMRWKPLMPACSALNYCYISRTVHFLHVLAWNLFSCRCAEQVRHISRAGLHTVRQMQQGARPDPSQRGGMPHQQSRQQHTKLRATVLQGRFRTRKAQTHTQQRL